MAIGLSDATLAFVLIGCAAPRDRPSGPLPDPSAFRIETVLFEMPLAAAERFYRPAEEREATLGFRVDMEGCRAALEELSRTDLAILRVPRPDLVVAPDAPGLVPDARSRESVRIEIHVRASATVREWAPVRLELGLRWLSPEGREIASMSGGSALLPENRWMRFVCLPPRASQADSRAVFGFLRVTPIFEVGSVAARPPSRKNP